MASKIKLSNANGKIVTIENNDSNMSDVTLNGASITKKVDTLADMRAMNELPETVWCSGYNSKNDGAFGSHFYRLKGLKTTEMDNSGTVIIVSVGGSDYVYELQYSGAVNVKWFGAVGDGLTDDTIAFQKANFKEDIFTPDGNYKINAELSGNIRGNKKTYIIPYNINKAAITLKNHGESWKYCNITNLSFKSINQTGIGIDFKDYVVGRYSFNNVDFKNFNIAVNRNLGNIGVSFYNCDFEYNNYAVKSLSSPLPQNMHNGNIYFHDCQFSEQKICTIYFDGDPAQAVFKNCIFEYNYGIDIFVKNGKGVGNYNDLYSSAISDCYFEGKNVRTGTVVIDGVTYDNQVLYFNNSRNFKISNSNINHGTFANTSLTTNNCYLGRIHESGECNITHDNALIYVNTDTTINSLHGKTLETSAYNHFCRKKINSFNFVPKNKIKGNILYSYNPYQIRAFDGPNISIIEDSNPYARIIKYSGALVFIGANTTIPITKAYCVSYMIAKTNSNDFKVTAPYVSSSIVKSSDEFICFSTIGKGGASLSTRWTITCPDNTSYLDVMQIGVAEFDTYQDCISFINSNQFVAYNNFKPITNVDFNQILDKAYWKTNFNIDFNNINYYSTKFDNSQNTNVPAGLFSTNFPEVIITTTYDSLSFEFTMPTRKAWIDKNGKRYATLTSV